MGAFFYGCLKIKAVKFFTKAQHAIHGKIQARKKVAMNEG
jgi:hypothetical protein